MSTDDGFPFPAIREYALAHRCSRCRAEPGQACVGSPAYLADKGINNMPFHAPRVDAGIKHRARDVARAPLFREPGRRYDTLDRSVMT